MFKGRKPRNLRNIKHYILNSLKFYELKNENLTPVIFVVILFTGFSGTIVSDMLAESVYLNVLYNAISFIVLNLASTVYLEAYLKELKGEVCPFKSCINHVLGKFYKIIIAYVAFVAIIITGLFLLIIPGIVFYFMFMFNICYILDKNIGVIEAFNTSRNLSYGRKMEIFAIYVVFNLTLFFPLLLIFIIATYTTNNLMFSFIISFITSVLTIMQQRLVAMLYTDLEYGISNVRRNDE
ncbi:MAG: hypothetical protein HPY74_00460 [Firmicutes bacterium]|nr:hypothetical protein [Bacillota bacterium]